MKIIYAIITVQCLLTSIPSYSQDNKKDLLNQVLQLDSLFWIAYNQCDVDKMQTFFTDDVEFYHDKGGLTEGSQKLFESIRTGLCGKADWRLRREAVKGTVRLFPLENYGAILSGEHYFYVNEAGKPEYLDGHAKFTHVWRYKDNTWKMHRILSYDHKAAPAASAKTQFEAGQKKKSTK